MSGPTAMDWSEAKRNEKCLGERVHQMCGQCGMERIKSHEGGRILLSTVLEVALARERNPPLIVISQLLWITPHLVCYVHGKEHVNLLDT